MNLPTTEEIPYQSSPKICKSWGPQSEVMSEKLGGPPKLSRPYPRWIRHPPIYLLGFSDPKKRS
jgi:hypothetical protein